MEVDRIEKQFDDCMAFLLRVNFFSLIKKVLTVCDMTVSLNQTHNLPTVNILSLNTNICTSSQVDVHPHVVALTNTCMLSYKHRLKTGIIILCGVLCRSYLSSSMWGTSLIWQIWLLGSTITIFTCLMVET
jgi:hypothetical protein